MTVGLHNNMLQASTKALTLTAGASPGPQGLGLGGARGEKAATWWATWRESGLENAERNLHTFCSVTQI
jgi:hypothetical protein